MQGSGQPGPARYRRTVQAIVKMVNAPSLSLRGGRRPTWRPEREARGSALGVQSREGTADANQLPIKWYAPIASVAAVSDRQGHAASVRRQSRQRLRSDRRYRRNRCIPLLAARPFRWPLLRLPQTQMPKPGVRSGRILKFVTNFSFFPLDFLPEMGII